MKVYYNKIELKTKSEWRDKVFVGKKSKSWKEGYSAESLAEFICKRNGARKLEELLSNVLGKRVQLRDAYPECEVKFDNYGHGREHDLAIKGFTENGNVFVGVEAKVNEPFGLPIIDVYQQSLKKLLNGNKSNGWKRIDELLIKYLGQPIETSDYRLRYQLLYSIAGTLMADRSFNEPFNEYVLLVLTFKTSESNDVCGNYNHQCFDEYVKRLKAVPINGVDKAYKVSILDKTLYLVYREIDLLAP